MKCRKCGSKDFITIMMVTGNAAVDLKNQEIDEVLDVDFDPAEVETASCKECNTEYRVQPTVINGLIELHLKEEMDRGY